MGRRLKLVAAVALVAVAWLAGRWVRHTRPRESPTERAHRLWGACGLRADEIDQLIDDARNATLTHEQKLELFYE